MKKIAFTILAALIVNFGLSLVSLAPAYAANDELKDVQFDITKNLSLGTDEQGQEYLYSQRDNESPIASLIISVIEFATQIIGTISVILLIIAGFIFMSSQGNQQQIDKAKDIFKYTVIGLLITFLSYLIVIFVQSLLL